MKQYPRGTPPPTQAYSQYRRISSWKEPTKAKEVAKTSNAELVILPGEVQAMEGADDYISWIDYIISALTSLDLMGTGGTEK